jgi:hypothetical protein
MPGPVDLGSLPADSRVNGQPGSYRLVGLGSINALVSIEWSTSRIVDKPEVMSEVEQPANNPIYEIGCSSSLSHALFPPLRNKNIRIYIRNFTLLFLRLQPTVGMSICIFCQYHQEAL